MFPIYNDEQWKEMGKTECGDDFAEGKTFRPSVELVLDR